MSLRSQIILGQYAGSIGDIPDYPASVNGILTNSNIVDDSVYNTISPINPLTGFRDNVLSRLFSSDTPTSEKQLILSMLSELKGHSSPSQLSDSDLLELLFSRYASDPVEIDRYKEYVEQLLQIAKDARNQEPQEPQEPVQPIVEPVPSPTPSAT